MGRLNSYHRQWSVTVHGSSFSGFAGMLRSLALTYINIVTEIRSIIHGDGALPGG
jgi:hypothetical protein